MDFTKLITEADSLERLRPLLRALGFGRRWIELPPEHWPESLRAGRNSAPDTPAVPETPEAPAPKAHVQRFALAGRRSSLHAFVIQVPQLTASTAGRIARRMRAHNPARLGFYIFVDGSFDQLAFGGFGASEDLRLLFIERANMHATDLEALQELVPRQGEGGLVLALRQASVLDRSRVSQRFFLDFKAQRAAVAEAWKGLPRAAEEDRRQLALLFLCRLMFLYFLQRRGHLGGDADYLYGLWRSWSARRHTKTFYSTRIKPLFFGVLNRRPEHRSAAARRLGALPYLNGGLFDRHALERKHRVLDLPDRAVRAVFDDLLQRYRFTTQDAAELAAARTLDAGIDPEMLGRVFEELMAEGQRGDTGTYFTPPPVVDRLVVRALHALTTARGQKPGTLQELRVLDPACGSGAFLLGALNRITEARAFLEGTEPDTLKREIVERVLHGVDVQADAALLCALRLWLSLLPSDPLAAGVQPLPNLDRNIRQGDALVDPLDLARASLGAPAESRAVAMNAEVRAALRTLLPAAARYVSAEPDERAVLQQELLKCEAALGRAWLSALRAALHQVERELRAALHERDLFGERTVRSEESGRALDALLERTRKLDDARALLSERKSLPFFNFDIHFPAPRPGFDLIVSNPPWVRAHRWPATLGRVIRDRYEVCRAAGWPNAGGSKSVPAAQVDLSLLFLERALHLLAPAGALAMLLPAKSFRSLYAGGARAMLLREARITYLEDHSLDQRSIFRADAFAAALVATNMRGTDNSSRGERTTSPSSSPWVLGGSSSSPSSSSSDVSAPASLHVVCYQRKAPPLEFDVAHDTLSLRPGDPASPWLLVPPDVNAAMRAMQAAGPTIGSRCELPLHRGVFTGANEVLLIDDVKLKLGDHAWIRAEGYTHTPSDRPRSAYRALIEESVLRPLVAGSGLRAWSYRSEQAILWSHDEHGRAVQLPPRATRYIERHRKRLRQRSGWATGQPLGAAFRAADHTVLPKVGWRDLAPTLEAVVLPARVSRWGRERELVPLNTVYYVSPRTERAALLICAYLNSMPVRTFVRAVAERAKDAYFRFFAWTINQVPLPRDWENGTMADRLCELAESALRSGQLDKAGQSQLDALVCAAFGLSAEQRASLSGYDSWLGAAHQ